MNKKNLTLVLILTFFLSVLLLAIVGKAMEQAGKIFATDIIFKDENGEVIELRDIKDEQGEIIEKLTVVDIFIEANSEPQDIAYHFTVEIVPSNTTNDQLDYDFIGVEGETIEERKENGPKLEETTERVLKEGKEDEYELNPVHTYTITFSKDKLEGIDVVFKFNIGGYARYKTIRFTIIEKNESQDIIDL